jgi:hypothetical protein
VGHLAALVVTGLRVGVAIDDLQCPLGILKLHLCVFLLLGVHLLLALPLTGRCAILALLLHLFTELFCELLDLPILHRGMACGVVHQALRTDVDAIGWLMGAFGAPANGRLLPAFFFFLMLSLPLPLHGAWAPALGVLSPFAAWVAGECQA